MKSILFENTNAMAYISTNHWDTKTHRNFFQLFINDQYINSFLDTKATKQSFVLPEEKIYKIEVIMSTW